MISVPSRGASPINSLRFFYVNLLRYFRVLTPRFPLRIRTPDENAALGTWRAGDDLVRCNQSALEI
jgi:hypothetical protein